MQWSVVAGAIVGTSIWLGDEGLNVGISVLQKGSGGGLIGNSSLAAAYLLFVVAFTCILLYTKEVKNKWWIILSLFIILGSPIFINVLGLFNGHGIMGSARAATAAIGVGLISALLCLLIFSNNSIKKVIGWFGIVVGIIGFFIIWNQLVTPGTKIHTKFVGATSEARFVFWDIAQKAISERPLVGYGPENFSIAIQRHFDPQLLSKDSGFETWSDRAHNVYYDTGVAGGYIGIALYAILLVSSIIAAYQAQKKNLFSKIEAAIFIGLIIAYVVQNLTVFDGFMSLFALYILLAILYGISSISTIVQKKSSQKKYQILTIILIVITAYGVYFFTILPFKKAYAFGSVMGDTLNKRPGRYMSLLKGSSVGNDWDVSGFAHDEYKLYAKNPTLVKNDTKLLPYGQKDVLAFIEYAEKVAEINKTDYRLYLSIVHLYSTYIYLGDLPYNQVMAEKIQYYIDHGHTLAPNDPQLYWAEAQLAAWKGDIPGVVSAYKKGIALDPNLAPSHQILIGFLRDIGEQKQYQSALLEAQKDIPGFTL
jgi:hypothetical protein